jgi:capsid portal protein
LPEYYLAKVPTNYYDYFAKLYSEIKPVKVAIDIMIENIVGNGYTFEYTGEGNPETAEKKKILKELIEVSEKLNFSKITRIQVKDTLVFGNSFIEIVPDEDGIKELRELDPRTVGIITDGKSVIAYAKIAQGNIVKCYLKENVMHVKNILPPIGSGWYGRSQIENLLPKIREKFEVTDVPTN